MTGSALVGNASWHGGSVVFEGGTEGAVPCGWGSNELRAEDLGSLPNLAPLLTDYEASPSLRFLTCLGSIILALPTKKHSSKRPTSESDDH